MDRGETIDLVGEMDLASVQSIRERVREYLAAGSTAAPLTVDLGGVTFMDSVGLGVLVSTRNDCMLAGVELTLVNVPAVVRRMLTVTGMTDVFTIDYSHPTEQVDPSVLPARTLLPAASDTIFDRIAVWASQMLDADSALVTLVHCDGQVMPGAVGAYPAHQAARETRLDQSICQFVVARGAELIVPDLGADPLFVETPAVTELGIRAYIGTPITRTNGNVVGSVCAMSGRPREWTPQQLAHLRALAAIASTELQAREQDRRLPPPR